MHHAAALALTALFALPAQPHPQMPPLPNHARYFCRYTDPQTTIGCCVWAPYWPSIPDGMGVWDCSFLPRSSATSVWWRRRAR